MRRQKNSHVDPAQLAAIRSDLAHALRRKTLRALAGELELSASHVDAIAHGDVVPQRRTWERLTEWYDRRHPRRGPREDQDLQPGLDILLATVPQANRGSAEDALIGALRKILEQFGGSETRPDERE
jgi:hypothetical protein